MSTTATKFISVIATLSICAVCVTAASADIHWRQHDTFAGGDEEMEIEQTVYVSGPRFAMENDRGMRMIINTVSGIFATVDLKAKTYFSIGLAELARSQREIDEDMEKLIEDAVTRLPEEERETYRRGLREKMEESRSGPAEPGWEDYSPTGETETILGYTARHYTATGEDGSTYEVWCTEDVPVAELSSLYRAIDSSGAMQSIGREHSLLNLGFPLKSRTVSEEETQVSVITDLSFGTIPNDIFIIPGDFTRSETPF